MSALDHAFRITHLLIRTGQLAIDKAVATRFIKHAIAQAKDTTSSNVPGPAAHIRLNDNNNDTGGGDGTASRDACVPIKVTEKMLEREKYHEALREEDLASDDDDDGALEVIDDEEDGPSSNEPETGRTPSPPLRELEFDPASSKEKGKGKGKGKAGTVVDVTSAPIPDDNPPSSTTASKRRRPPMDPFAGLYRFRSLVSSYLSQPSFLFTGYGDSPDTRSVASADTSAATSTLRSGTKIRRVHMED